MTAECAAASSKAWRVTQAVIIKVRESGPYLIKGPITLTDAEGNSYPVGGENVALCRCGGSQTKPFCDGSHRTNGFSATGRAPTDEVPS